ncbi:MAG: glycosyltransferase family 4 protein [Actinomycetota bacterium]
MRLLYVVHRYHSEIPGGAEIACRLFATQMAGRGHDVAVVTSCARDYVDWADVYPAGTTNEDGVLVHRLPVSAPRDIQRFNRMCGSVRPDAEIVPWDRQQQWLVEQGPHLPDLARWLDANYGRFDAVVVFTYLYYPASVALRTLAGRVPIVFHPCAHEEWPLHLSLYDTPFRIADAFAYFTPEEEQLVRERFDDRVLGEVLGIGLDIGAATQFDDGGARFRAETRIGDRPYITYVGRLDRSKGVAELAQWFRIFRERTGRDLVLTLLGDEVHPIERADDVVVTGPVSEELRQSAVSGAACLVHPSYFESFSMVLTETWALARPVLVQGRCDVLAGQARRAGGGVAYRGYAEFEAALERVLDDEALATMFGQRGHDYVRRNYDWDVLAPRYERLLEKACSANGT